MTGSAMAVVLGCALAVLAGPKTEAQDLAPTPPMGWNSWNTFQTRIDEDLIKSTADAMIANGMRDAGYVYVNLDDGWSAKERDADGNLVGDPQRFPDGMKALGDYLHARGLQIRNLQLRRHGNLRGISRSPRPRISGCQNLRFVGRGLSEVRLVSQRGPGRARGVQENARGACGIRTADRLQHLRMGQ